MFYRFFNGSCFLRGWKRRLILSHILIHLVRSYVQGENASVRTTQFQIENIRILPKYGTKYCKIGNTVVRQYVIVTSTLTDFKPIVAMRTDKINWLTKLPNQEIKFEKIMLLSDQVQAVITCKALFIFLPYHRLPAKNPSWWILTLKFG